MSDNLSVDSDHVRRAGRVALLGTGPLLALSLVIVVILALAAAPEKHHGSILDWLRSAIWLGGLAWHGTLSATIRGNAGATESSPGTYDATSYATIAPLLLTLFTLTFLAWAARDDERQRPSTSLGQLAARSVVSSAFLGVTWFLLSTTTRASSGFGLDLSDFMGLESFAQLRVGVGLDAVPTALSVLLLSLAVILGARLATAPGHLPSSERLGSWLLAFSAAVRLSIAVAVATTAVAVTYLLVQVIQAIGEDSTAITSVASNANDTSGSGALVVIAVGLLTLPNLLITGSGFAVGSDLAAAGDGTVSGSLPSLLGMSDLPFTTYSYGLFTDSERPAWLYILLLTSLFAALAAGIRSIVRTQPTPLRFSTTAQWAIALAALWVFVTWLASVGFGVSGRAAGDVTTIDSQSIGALRWDGRAGLSYAGIIGLAMLWAGVAYISAHWLTPRLGGSAPRTIAAIGGTVDRRLHPSWALMLADAGVRLGKDLPGWLRSAADEAALNGFAAEQLRLRPGTARRIVVIGGTASLLFAMAFIGRSVLASTTYGPATAAKAYLNDVASGNARGAIERTDMTGGNAELLTASVLRAQLKESPMSSVRIERTRTTNLGASVDVTYSIDGAEQSTTLSLIQDENQPEWGGLFHPWRVRNPFAEVTIAAGGGPIQLGGLAVSPGSTYRVFPGVIPATTAATPLLTATSAKIRVQLPGSSSEVSLEPALRENVITEVRAKIVKELLECSRQKILVPRSCPFGSSDFVSGRAVGVTWKWTSDIAAAVSVEYNGIGGTLSASGEVPMTVTYTDVSEFSTTAESDEVTADLSANVSYANKDDISIQWSVVEPGN